MTAVLIILFTAILITIIRIIHLKRSRRSGSQNNSFDSDWSYDDSSSWESSDSSGSDFSGGSDSSGGSSD